MSEAQGSSTFLYFTTISVNLVSFSTGTALAWSSPSLPRLNGQVDPDHNPISPPITPSEESLIASLIAIGALFGPFLAAIIGDKFGRKKALLIAGVPLYISWILIALADQTWHLYIARFLVGFAISMFFVILPNYVAEIAQKHNRGALSCFITINITLGNVFIYSVGAFLEIKYTALVCLIAPTVFFVLVTIYVPESPYFYMAKNCDAEAEIVLRKLRGGADVQNELAEIKTCVQEAYANKNSFMDLFRNKVLLKGIMLTFGLVLFQQFSGVNAILFYLQSIFAASGSDLPAEISTIIIGLVQFMAALVVPFLVDRFGRRFLLLVAGGGTTISLAAIGAFFYILDHGMSIESISWLPTVSLVVFIVTYSMGFGPIPFMILGEIFPSNFKGIASTLTICLCFVFTFITTVFFPGLLELIGTAQSFWVFCAFCVLSLFFTYFLLPETRGKSLSEIQKMMSK